MASRSAPNCRGSVASTATSRDCLRQQGRQATRQLPQRARFAAGQVGPRIRRARTAARRGGVVARSRRHLSDQAFEYDREGRHHIAPLPSDIVDEEHRIHDELIEEIVSGDDEQLERYLSGDVPTTAELERTLAHEVLDRLEFPVLVGSALTGVGIDRLADFICEIGPSPADRPMAVMAGTEQIEVPADATAQPLGIRVQDLGRPVRRPGVAVQGRVRHHFDRRPSDRQRDIFGGAAARTVPHPRQRAVSVPRVQSRATSWPSPSSPTRRPARRWHRATCRCGW